MIRYFYMCIWVGWIFSWSSFLVAQSSFVVSSASENAKELLEKAEKASTKDLLKTIKIYKEVYKKYSSNMIERSSKFYLCTSEAILEQISRMPMERKRELIQKIEKQMDIAEIKTAEDFYPHYLLTNSGRKKLIEFIDYEIFNEKYEAALTLISWYLNNNRRISYGLTEYSAVIARMVWCHYSLGHHKVLEQLAKDSTFEISPVKIGDKKILLSTYIKRLLSKVSERHLAMETADSWPTYGNSYYRNSFVESFELDSLPNPKVQKLVVPGRANNTGYVNDSKNRPASINPNYPIVADGMIFISNGKDIFAYNLFSGKLIWQFEGIISKLDSNPNGQVVHSVTYDDAALYINIEGDTPTQSLESWHAYKIRDILPERRLIKLDAHTGRFIWQVNNPSGDDESFENRASFMTPPTVWGDYLYVGATELTGIFNSYVVAVNKHTGKIVWKNMLGSAQQEMNMFGRPVREAVGSSVVMGDGCLYYLSHLGAICCADPLTGKILWMSMYDRVKIPEPGDIIYRTLYRKTTWYNSPVILSGERLFFAPLDSRYLYAYNARTGREIWRYARQKAQRFLLAATDKYLILGGENITLVDIRNGLKIKSFSLNQRPAMKIGEKRNEVLGKGILTKTHFYFATGKFMGKLNLKQQSLEKWQWQNSKHAGNMIYANSSFLTASKTSLNIFIDKKRIEAKINREIQKTPNSPSGYLKLANFFQGQGNLEKAKGFYQQAWKKSQRKGIANQSVYLMRSRSGLIDTMLSLAEKTSNNKNRSSLKYYDSALSLASETNQIVEILFAKFRYVLSLDDTKLIQSTFQQIMDDYGRQVIFLKKKKEKLLVGLYAHILLGDHYANTNRPKKAIDHYQLILSNFVGGYYEKNPVHEYAHKEIQRLITKHGQEIYKKYENLAREEYRKEKSRERFVPSAMQTLLIKYYNSSYSIDICQSLLDYYTQDRQFALSSQIAKEYLKNKEASPKLLPIYTRLIDLYEKENELSQAKKMVLTMVQENWQADTSLTVNGKSLAKYINEKLSKEKYQKTPVKLLPILKLWTSERSKHFFPEPRSTNPRLVSTIGFIPEQYEHMFFLNLDSTLYCRDGRNGRLLWAKNTGWISRVAFAGNNLVVWGFSSISVLSPTTGNLNWKSRVAPRFVSLSVGVDVIGFISYRSHLRKSTITILDANSGNKIWSSEILGKHPNDLIITKDKVIASTRSNAQVFDLKNGNVLRRWHKAPNINQQFVPFYTYEFGEKHFGLLRDQKWLECYRLSDLSLVWKKNTSEVYLSRIVGNDDYVTFINNESELNLVDTKTGETKWTRPLRDRSALLELRLEGQTVYYIEKRELNAEVSIWAIDIQGNSKWSVFFEEYRQVFLKTMTTQKYLIVIKNREVTGYQSYVDVYNKKTGQHLRSYEAKSGRGPTRADGTIKGGLLWLTKDNHLWAIGK